MPVVPFANWRPVPSHSGPMQAHQGLVLHVQVGNGSCYGEFSNPANQASSTWWVSKSGVLEQYVDSDNAAWTEAAGNFTWDSVETEGEPSEPLTPSQIVTLGRLYAWGVQTYGWPVALAESPSDHGLGWHGMGGVPWGNHPGCPGDIRRAQRQSILNFVGPSPPAPTPAHTTTILEELFAMPSDNGFAVRFVYRFALHREVDPAGFTANVNWLNAGGSLNDVLAHLQDSAEGQAVIAAERKALGI